MSHIVFEQEPGARRDVPNFTMPRPIGRMMVGMAVLAVLVAAGARYFGLTARVDNLAPVLAQRALVLRDLEDGGVQVLDGRTGGSLSVIANEDSARFLRTMLRGLAPHTQRREKGPDVSFTLEMRENGQLTVTRDGSTRINSVNGFGLSQVASLERLLVAR